MSKTRIIILNGVSSVGKSSTARALQTIAAEPFMHVAMDAFLDMLPGKLFGRPEGMISETTEDNGKPSIVVRTGPAIEPALRGVRDAVAAMAAQGNPPIVDEVMTLGQEAGEYRALLADFDVPQVGLVAPLDIVEARERERGDREISLARWQYHRVHLGVAHDLEIDTTAATPVENARTIRDAFGL